jgi:hypothetical protein
LLLVTAARVHSLLADTTMPHYTIELFMLDSDVFVRGVVECMHAACLVKFTVERQEIVLAGAFRGPLADYAIANGYTCKGATAKPNTQPALVWPLPGDANKATARKAPNISHDVSYANTLDQDTFAPAFKGWCKLCIRFQNTSAPTYETSTRLTSRTSDRDDGASTSVIEPPVLGDDDALWNLRNSGCWGPNSSGNTMPRIYS